jgi:hypothetical protein
VGFLLADATPSSIVFAYPPVVLLVGGRPFLLRCFPIVFAGSLDASERSERFRLRALGFSPSLGGLDKSGDLARASNVTNEEEDSAGSSLSLEGLDKSGDLTQGSNVTDEDSASAR